MMKSVGTLAHLCLVVLAISTLIQAQTPPILDTSGQPLRRGVRYYVLSDIRPSGGGLTVITRNASCPVYVAQDVAGSSGLPVTFDPLPDSETLVREGSNTGITFSGAARCGQSLAWRVGEEDPDTRRRLITTGLERGPSVLFRVHRNQGSYNLGWCPSNECEKCRPSCGAAGILIKDGKRFFALGGAALPVVFRRA